MNFNKIFNKIIILQKLTQDQMKQVDQYSNKGLDFGPFFKEQRTYFNLKVSELQDIKIPQNLLQQIQKAGFYITNYRNGIAMKKTQSGKPKDLRQIKLGKILNKLKNKELLKQFNERLSTSRKEISELNICITHNPYDIAGMSTDRNWTSCMNLDKGCHRETALLEIEFGGMCAYLIKKEDKLIEEPLARIAIKRLLSQDHQPNFIFLSEKVIYGDVELGKELLFNETVEEILQKSNQITAGNSAHFQMQQQYDDEYYQHLNNDDQDQDFDQNQHKLIWSDQEYTTVTYFSKNKLQHLTTQEFLKLGSSDLQNFTEKTLNFLLNKFHKQILQSNAYNKNKYFIIFKYHNLLEKYHDCLNWKNIQFTKYCYDFFKDQNNRKIIELHINDFDWRDLNRWIFNLYKREDINLFDKNYFYYLNKYDYLMNWNEIIQNSFHNHETLFNLIFTQDFLNSIKDNFITKTWISLLYKNIPKSFIQTNIDEFPKEHIITSKIISIQIIDIFKNKFTKQDWQKLLNTRLQYRFYNWTNHLKPDKEEQEQGKKFILAFKDYIDWSQIHAFYNVFSFEELIELKDYINYLDILTYKKCDNALFEFLYKFLPISKIFQMIIENNLYVGNIVFIQNHKNEIQPDLLLKYIKHIETYYPSNSFLIEIYNIYNEIKK